MLRTAKEVSFCCPFLILPNHTHYPYTLLIMSVMLAKAHLRGTNASFAFFLDEQERRATSEAWEHEQCCHVKEKEICLAERLQARMEKGMILTICDGKEQKKNAVKEVLLDFCSREQLELMEMDISGISLFLQKGQEELIGEEVLQELFLKLSQERNQITYSFVEGQTTLPVEDILYVESNKHKNWFHTAEATYSIYRKLNDIEQELKEYGFIRIHQSFLVNMRYIAKISSYTLTLTSGETFSVPKVRYSHVKRKFMKYKGVEFE